MKNKILNKNVINEIQSYLSAINWAQSEHKCETLNTYLRGVEDALFEDGLAIVLKRELTNSYMPGYCVELGQYEDFTDCWSNKKILMKIYENRVEEFEEI